MKGRAGAEVVNATDGSIMSQQDVQAVRGGYDAFNRKDIPAVLDLYDEQIEWIEAGGGRAPAGTFRGTQSVAKEVFATVPQNFDDFHADLSSSLTLVST